MIEVRLKDYVEYQGNTPLEDKTVSKGTVLPLGDVLSSLIKTARKPGVSHEAIMKDFAMYADFLDENNKQRLLHLVLLIELRKDNRNITKEHIKLNDFFKDKVFLNNSVYKDYLVNFFNKIEITVPKTTFGMFAGNISINAPTYTSQKELSYWDKLAKELDNTKDLGYWKNLGSVLENTSEKLSTCIVSALACSNDADEYFKNMNIEVNPQELKNANLLVNTYYEVMFPVEKAYLAITEDSAEELIAKRKTDWEMAIWGSFNELRSLVDKLKNENQSILSKSTKSEWSAHDEYRADEKLLLVEIRNLIKKSMITEENWLDLASQVGIYMKDEKDGVLGELFYQIYQNTPYESVQKKLLEESEFEDLTRFVRIKREDNEIAIDLENKEKFSFILKAIKPEYIEPQNQLKSKKFNKLRKYFLDKLFGGENLRGDFLSENWYILDKSLHDCVNKMMQEEFGIFQEKAILSNEEVLQSQKIRLENKTFEIPMLFKVSEPIVQDVIEKTVNYFMPMAFLYEDFSKEKVENVFETFKEESLMKMSAGDSFKSPKTKFKKF